MESFSLIVAFVSVAVSALFTLWATTTTRIASSCSRPGHEYVGDAGATTTNVESKPDQTHSSPIGDDSGDVGDAGATTTNVES